jgi:hypothetical protein
LQTRHRRCDEEHLMSAQYKHHTKKSATWGRRKFVQTRKMQRGHKTYVSDAITLLARRSQ